MRSSRVRIAVAIVWALLAGSGCAGSEEPRAPTTSTSAVVGFPNWPPLANGLRFHWSAEPGIDLLAGSSVAIRAYLESYLLATVFNSLDAVYPGFWRAVRAEKENADVLLGNSPVPGVDVYVPTEHGPYRNKPWYGTVFLHLLRVEPTETGLSARVCYTLQGLYLVTPEGKYEPSMPEGATPRLVVKRVDIQDNVGSGGVGAPPDPVAAQRGPMPAPVDDVFGGWVVLGANSLPVWAGQDGKATLDPETDALESRCRQDMQTPGLQLPPPVLDNPPAIVAPVPGWPAQAG